MEARMNEPTPKVNMVRTMVFLRPEQHQELLRRGVLAEQVRKAVDIFLSTETSDAHQSDNHRKSQEQVPA
jgi:hypothetical protein